MTQAFRNDTPYHWWGPGPVPPAPLTLQDLLRNGTIDIECAATLWASLAQHRSLTVIGGPSGLGKSTLLHALLPAVPQENRRVYLRGCYETFSFLGDPRFPAATTVLLVNEFSPHLPVYVWGPAVQRTLAVGEAGYQVLATAHGRTVVEFVASLTGSPLRIPARMLAALDLVALIEPASNESGRRVSALWQLSTAQNGVSVDQLGPGDLPVGVTTLKLDAARTAVLSFVEQGASTPGTARPDSSCGEKVGLPGARAATDLEQRQTGE